jgi:excisionase family DNA binding protein
MYIEHSSRVRRRPLATRRFLMKRKLLTIGEVCERTGLGRTLVYRLVSTGELPSIKVGRTRRVPVAALDAFIGEQLTNTSEEGAI